MAEVFDKARSSNSLLKLLKEKGHQLYKRNNKIVGIQKKRKWRFKTLGYSIGKIQLLDKNIEKDNRLQQIKHLRNNHSKDKGRER
ncbi:MAG: hypothetical protein PSN34_11735 [Urechidicola sp.]|nr:hypothetical protein [Urechidicola sp.]